MRSFSPEYFWPKLISTLMISVPTRMAEMAVSSGRPSIRLLCAATSELMESTVWRSTQALTCAVKDATQVMPSVRAMSPR